uniref:U6-Lycotoxin-Lsp1d_1 n=1 Tax=Lycosa sp. SGP-2016 TaxID=1905177 RepID=A0A482ZJL9_9ARAC
MKVLVLFSVFFLTLFSYSSTKAIDEFDNNAEEDMLSLLGKEEMRAKTCTPLLHDCSHDRHSCCRGELFKYVCYCFYPEGEDIFEQFASTATVAVMRTVVEQWGTRLCSHFFLAQ